MFSGPGTGTRERERYIFVSVWFDFKSRLEVGSYLSTTRAHICLAGWLAHGKQASKRLSLPYDKQTNKRKRSERQVLFGQDKWGAHSEGKSFQVHLHSVTELLLFLDSAMRQKLRNLRNSLPKPWDAHVIHAAYSNSPIFRDPVRSCFSTLAR